MSWQDDIRALLRPAWMALRTMVRAGTVALSDYAGDVPQVQVTANGDQVRNISFPGQFGFLSRPTAATRLIYVKVGDNPDDLVAIASIDPDAVPVELAVGEAVVFAESGAYTHFKANGHIDVMPAGAGTINLAGTADSMALATKVQGKFDALYAAINAATIVVGAAGAADVGVRLTANPAWALSIASTKVKGI